MNELENPEEKNWGKSRHGAWASRGFHYQHLVITQILLQQWAGLVSAGWVVPEGLEDCVVELLNRKIYIQIKSRKKGVFSKFEVENIFSEMKRKAAGLKNGKKIQLVLVLEQSCSDVVEYNLDQLFENKREKVIVCHAPEETIVALLTRELSTAEIIAEGIRSDLHTFVAETSASNASNSYGQRRRISTTEIEHRIFERLEAEDPSIINQAFRSRALEPVDFFIPTPEPGFFQGVKAKPGHVSAGLVLKRPRETAQLTRLLKHHRHLLVTGPSGAGKSALVWLLAHALAADFRWFQITTKAGVQDSDAIIRFVRSRRPKKISPIALVFDEIGASNSDLWDVLVHELRALSHVYFLGSIRKENLTLISNQSDTQIFEVNLDEILAQDIWKQLAERQQTNWSHWREPFEKSECLMLEYVHLLTQGKRLVSLVRDQVRQREKEGRDDELAIIRTTSVLCARGGEIESKPLFELLGLSPIQASKALKRLISEHLVRETRPGVLGGLHALRSKALADASHDEVVYHRLESLWQGVQTSTLETLPRIIQSLFADTKSQSKEDMLKKLAEILAKSKDADFWAAILTGLGLGTLERQVVSFISILEKRGIQQAQWSLASMFASSGVDVPELERFEDWNKMRDAILEFHAQPKDDLRITCLEILPESGQMPPTTNLLQTNQLLCCLVPIAGGEPLRMTFMLDFLGDKEHDIQEVADLLATAYLIGPDVAQNFMFAFGGEQTLLSWFHSQTPWLKKPVIETNGNHGRTVHADWYFVTEDYQPDPHETVCNICKILLALSPESEAAASDAIDSEDHPIRIGDHLPYSKNIPRKNLPAKTSVAWNVAFGQILLARANAHHLTAYAQNMTGLVIRTEKLFRSFSEKWIRGSKVFNPDQLIDEIKKITNTVNSLAYSGPKPSKPQIESLVGDLREDDMLGALLTGIVNNLVPRIVELPAESGSKALATFAGSLADQADDHIHSSIWRTVSSPPIAALKSLSKRLNNIKCILHEMAWDETQTKIAVIVKTAKKGSIGKAVLTASLRCRLWAEQRLREKLNILENTLKKQGWDAKCWTRPITEGDSVYWPPLEVTILIDVVDFESDSAYADDSLSVGQKILGQECRFRIAPVIKGQVISQLALLPSSQMPLPDQNFAKIWKTYIDLPFLSAELTEAFEKSIKACHGISAILSCCDLRNLHPEEDNTLSKAMDDFKDNRSFIADKTETSDVDIFADALVYLDETWKRVVDEHEIVNSGQAPNNPLCMDGYNILSDNQNEKMIEFGIVKMLLLQAECRMTT